MNSLTEIKQKVATDHGYESWARFAEESPALSADELAKECWKQAANEVHFILDQYTGMHAAKYYITQEFHLLTD